MTDQLPRRFGPVSPMSPVALPVMDPPPDDACERCGATYGPNFGHGIYSAWLTTHARMHTTTEES